MTFLTIVTGVFEIGLLFILTGFLVTLAVLSHIMEWTFTIVNPIINIFLHQVNELIILLIIPTARLSSRIMAGMFPCQVPPDSSNCPAVIANIEEIVCDDTNDIMFSPPLSDLEGLQEIQEEIITEG